MDKRLIKMMQSGKIRGGVTMIDTYNQIAYADIACTIKSTINNNNAYFIIEWQKKNTIGKE